MQLSVLMVAVSVGLSLTFISLTHPVLMVVSLVTQALLISVIISSLGATQWFAYILFLVFLGGVLVLFMYMTSLASNEKLSYSWGPLALTTGCSLAAALLLDCLAYTPYSAMEGSGLSWGVENSLADQASKFFGSLTAPTSVFAILYLLLALVVAVKVMKIYGGPLRPLF